MPSERTDCIFTFCKFLSSFFVFCVSKHIKSEHDTAVQERDALKKQLSAVSSELTAYKKKEEDTRFYSRKKLNADAKRISHGDELSRKLKKAEAFISACGLSSDYQQLRYNSTTRKTVLE